MPTSTPPRTSPKPMERLKLKFAEAGLEPRDLVPALVVHEVLGLAMALGLWGACHAIQPSRAVAGGAFGGSRVRPPKPLAALYARSLETATATLSKASGRSAMAQLCSRVDPARATVSLAESLCLRAALKPATLVFKIWASAAIVARGKKALASRSRASKAKE